MAAADDSSTTPINILRRRNSTGTRTPYSYSPSSTATTTTATSSSSLTSSSSSSSVDFELNAIKPTCYTSLRDILPSPAAHVQSPKAPVYSGYEISIRNPLVKHAAWAYLQPMSTSPEADGATVLHRLWTQFSGAVLSLITAAFDCFLPPIQVGTAASKL